jgi:hypothetical protein
MLIISLIINYKIFYIKEYLSNNCSILTKISKNNLFDQKIIYLI